MKRLGFLWAIVILVVSYTYFFEFKGKQEKEVREQEGKKLFYGEFGNMESIEVQGLHGNIKLIRDHGVWNVLVPYQDLAEIGSIQNLFNTLSNEYYEDIVTAEIEDPSIYGLDEPYWIEIRSDSEKTRLRIGSVTGMSGKKYIQKEGESTVYLGTYSWENLINKKPEEFRKKALFDISEAQISKIEVQSQGQSLIFEKPDRKWSLQGLNPEDADSSTVESYISSLLTLRASDTDGGSKAKGTPLDIQITPLEGEVIRAKVFSVDEATSSVTLSNRPVPFKISNAVATTFKKVQNDFRDKSYPFKFDKDQISKIELVTQNARYELEKEKNNWKVEEDQKDQVHLENVEGFLNKVRGLRVRNYLGKDIPFQKSGAESLELRSGEEVLLSLEWSPRVITDMYVLKSSRLEEFLGVPVSELKALKNLIEKSQDEKKETP